MMVDQNILKLELKRIRENLNDRSDDVLSQEKRRLQLETVSRLIKKSNISILELLFFKVQC